MGWLEIEISDFIELVIQLIITKLCITEPVCEKRWLSETSMFGRLARDHYPDVIMTTMASQITSLTVVYSIVYSGADQRNHQSSASLAFVRWIHPAQRASNAENVSIWWRHHHVERVLMRTHEWCIYKPSTWDPISNMKINNAWGHRQTDGCKYCIKQAHCQHQQHPYRLTIRNVTKFFVNGRHVSRQPCTWIFIDQYLYHEILLTLLPRRFRAGHIQLT